MWERTSRLSAAKIGTYPNSSEYAIEYARNVGLVVVTAKRGTLQLDIDTKDQLLKCHIALHTLDKALGIKDVVWTQSPGGKGFHIYVDITFYDQPLPGLYKGWTTDDYWIWTCQMQATLGSDPVREANGVLRVHNHDDTPTLMFEKKGYSFRPYDQLYTRWIKPLETKWLVGKKARRGDTMVHRVRDNDVKEL